MTAKLARARRRGVLAATAVLLALAGACPAPLWAAGATGEEESLADLNSGRQPLVLTPDGQWLVMVEGGLTLVRRRLAAPEPAAQRLRLPDGAMALSASRDGARVAFMTVDGCVGLARLEPDGAAPRLQWWPRPKPGSAEPTATAEAKEGDANSPRPCPPEAKALGPHGQPRRHYQPYAVGLSADGRRLAVPAALGGHGVLLVDTDSTPPRHPRRLVPITEPVLHLRFIDGDRRLLVVSAAMGEPWEGAGRPSDLLFSVWDVAEPGTGRLLHLARTANTEALRELDLLWAFSEATGRLWHIATHGQRFKPDTHRRVPVQPQGLLLARCGATPDRRLSLPVSPDSQWLELAADPLGRWLAAIDTGSQAPDTGALPPSPGPAAPTRGGAMLRVWDARSGRPLAVRPMPMPSELRSLVPAPDGRSIFGMLSGLPQSDASVDSRDNWAFPQPGPWHQALLPATATRPPADPPVAWPAAGCPVEDEAPGAREIAPAPTAGPRLRAELALTDLRAARETVLAVPGAPAGPDTCGIDDETDSNLPRVPPWGLGPDGALWLDRWSHLERVDPATGQLLARLPTPRSATVCSSTDTANARFLSWQGDTVTLRPLAERLDATARRVLVRRPGWHAQWAGWVAPDRLGVRWVKSALWGRPDAEGPEGSALAITYRVDATGPAVPLLQKPGDVRAGRAVFAFEGGEGVESPFDAPDPEALDDARRGVKADALRWSASHFGSARAWRPAPPAAATAATTSAAAGTAAGAASAGGGTVSTRTVLWDGLALRAPDAPSPPSDRVRSLGGSLGAAQAGDRLVVYDAERRRRLLQATLPGMVEGLAWHPGARRLLVEVHDGRSSPPGTWLKLLQLPD